MKKEVAVILGAGLAGISLAYFLKKKNVVIFEKESAAGGLCRSQEVSGFIFDYDGHFLHARTYFFRNLIYKLLKGGLLCCKRKASVYFKGKFLPYPFQFNYQKAVANIEKKKEVKPARRAGPRDFFSWCLNKFGEDISENFLYPYNEKFWEISLKKLDYRWAEKFIPLEKNKINIGYNWEFFYPSRGMQEFIHAFLSHLETQINLGFEAEAIDIKRKTVGFKNGFSISYDKLFVSLPLAKLGSIIKDLPGRIKSRLSQLRFTSLYVLNLGLKSNLTSWGHWIYFSQDNIVFFRVGFPSNVSKDVVPVKFSSLYAEVSIVFRKTIDKIKLENKIICDLEKVGIIKKKDIVEKLGMFIEYGYPMPLLGKDKIVEEVEQFLKPYGIYLIGRYGCWQYYSMEDVVLRSRAIATATA